MNEIESREFELKAELEEKRKEIKTFDDLVKFLEYVKDNCNCGYGEAPRAAAQAALAAAWYICGEFGLTGFQAGFVMWDFIKGWLYDYNKCGLMLVDYDNMLYPQYADKFEKTITSDVFKALQKTAEENLKNKEYCHPYVVKHWQSIVDGKVPFGYRVVDR